MKAHEIKHPWMQQFHQGTERAVHMTGYLVHEKSFWAIVAILVGIAALISLLMIFGQNSVLENYHAPIPCEAHF